MNKIFLFIRMAEVAKTLEELRKVKGWERFPLPECVYKQFNIEKPKQYDGLMDYLQDVNKAWSAGGCYIGEIETRPPAEGGVREIGSLPLPEIAVESNQTKQLLDHHSETQSESETYCSSSDSQAPQNQ